MSTQPNEPFKYTPYAHFYASPKGPGDSRPTALDIVRDLDLLSPSPDLPSTTPLIASKLTILITGASDGIGVETARALAATGARLLLTARNLDKGKRAVESIEASHPVSKGRLTLIEMDLANLENVKKAAREVERLLAREGNGLNGLVCNAGLGARPLEYTTDDHESCFQVNYLSHFLLFQLLLPLLHLGSSSSSPSNSGYASRVILVSSLSHRFSRFSFSDPDWRTRAAAGSYNPAAAYGESKCAMVWMANEIERRYGRASGRDDDASGSTSVIHAYSVHPGAITGTNIAAETSAEDMVASVAMMGYADVREMVALGGKYLMDAGQGAATTVWAVLDRGLEGRGGVYLEDCGVGRLFGSGEDGEGEPAGLRPGYASWAFDEAEEGRLWGMACGILGIEG